MQSHATTPSVRHGPDKCALIIIENQPYFVDTRVKAEATSLREAGWRVHVICPTGVRKARGGGREAVYSRTEQGGVSVHSYRMGFASDGVSAYIHEYLISLFRIARLSWRIFRHDGFSIVHLCNPPDVLFIVGAFYKLLGRKVIFDHHDLFPEMILSRHKGGMRRVLHYLSRGLEFMTFRTADAVLSTNQSYRDIAVHRGGVDERSVFVVRNGPKSDETILLPPDPALKKGFAFMACYAGIMGPDDGVLELMHIIRHIVLDLRREDVLFCLLGDGAAWGEISRRAKAWGIEAFVDMPGYVFDRNLLRKYFATADVMLAPEISSPHNDRSTFIKIAEYMAVGKPIVAYDLRESRFTAGDAASFVPSGDLGAYAAALIGLLDDPGRRARMGRIGIERVKTRFQWEHQKAPLLKAYDHVLRARSILPRMRNPI